MTKIIGADLALLHGALVDAGGEIIFTYVSEDGMDSSLESLFIRGYNAAMVLPMGCTVIIDFDRTCGSWGGKKKNASVGTLLMLLGWGFGTIARIKRNAEVQYVSPSAVRQALNLPPQTSKPKVHESVKHLLPIGLRGNKFHSLKDVRGDCIDAWLLAFTYSRSK